MQEGKLIIRKLTIRSMHAAERVAEFCGTLSRDSYGGGGDMGDLPSLVPRPSSTPYPKIGLGTRLGLAPFSKIPPFNQHKYWFSYGGRIWGTSPLSKIPPFNQHKYYNKVVLKQLLQLKGMHLFKNFSKGVF